MSVLRLASVEFAPAAKIVPTTGSVGRITSRTKMRELATAYGRSTFEGDTTRQAADILDEDAGRNSSGSLAFDDRPLSADPNPGAVSANPSASGKAPPPPERRLRQ